MHFHDQAVGTDNDSGPRQHGNKTSNTSGVTRVDDHGKVRHGLQHRHGSDVQRVARCGFEGANAALAEDDLLIACHRNDLCGTQKFFERRGHATLQQNGPPALSERFEQGVVLHAARAHLHDVGIFRDQFDIFLAHHFGDDRESGRFAGLAAES